MPSDNVTKNSLLALKRVLRRMSREVEETLGHWSFGDHLSASEGVERLQLRASEISACVAKAQEALPEAEAEAIFPGV